jgi:SPP1 gp7 family putative phage head morphogenesis protein
MKYRSRVYSVWPYRRPSRWPWRYRVLLQAGRAPWERRVRVRQQNLDLQVRQGTALLAGAFNPILAYVRDHLERFVDPLGPSAVPDNVLRPFENAIWAVRILGDLIGRWHVEAYRPDRVRLQGDDEAGVFVLTPGIPFREAIEALLRRRLVPPEVFKELSDLEKVRAFTIARATAWVALTRMREILVKALEEGMTLKQFRDEVLTDAFIRSGVSSMEPYYLETVFRTNLFSAYMAGRFRGLQAYADRIAFFRYVTMEDERVRPAHARMHGFTARPNDPIWAVWWPPNGYNCRCDIEPIWADDPEAGRLRPSRAPDVLPDKGFRANPALEAIPKDILRRALKYGAFTNEDLDRMLGQARAALRRLESAGLPEELRDIVRHMQEIKADKLDDRRWVRLRDAYRRYYERYVRTETQYVAKRYKGTAYGILNDLLRLPRQTVKSKYDLDESELMDYERALVRLQELFESGIPVVMHRYIEVIRGEGHFHFGITPESAWKYLQAVQPGDTFRMPQFVSTSLQYGTADDFLNSRRFDVSGKKVGVLWQIRIPQGQRAFIIDAIPNSLQHEREVLLPPGTVLRIVRKTLRERGDQIDVILEAEVIGVEATR